MNYPKLLEKLLLVNRFSGVKLGLERALQLQKRLDYPDRSFKTVHIAGTNGKGSVSIKIAEGLSQSGLRVGLYTSPHLCSFRERMRINGIMISEKEVEEGLQKLFALIETDSLPATFFELTTFLAFDHFAKEKIDVAVVETGLGGRLDATNVIAPCLSIITSISLDHTEILGTTLEAIAREKGGIIKPNTPVIIGPRVPLEQILPIARQNNSRCTRVEGNFSLYEEENQAIASCALQELAHLFPISKSAIAKGIEKKQPCRFEQVQKDPIVILDVAHNPDGVLHLIRMIDFFYPNQAIRFLFGLSENKDIAQCVKLLAQKGTRFHLVAATNGRAACTEKLNEELLRHGVDKKKIALHSSIAQGVALALKEGKREKDIVVACGSFFIMAQVRQALGIKEPHDHMDLNEKTLSCTTRVPCQSLEKNVSHQDKESTNLID